MKKDRENRERKKEREREKKGKRESPDGNEKEREIMEEGEETLKTYVGDEKALEFSAME